MRRILLITSLACAVLLGQATKKASKAAHHGVRATAPDTLKWGPLPAGAIQGQPPADLPPLRSELAVVEGDPSKPGPFVIRIKSPDGEKIPPHWHPAEEHVTVLQGTFVLGDGDKYSDDGKELTAGGYASVPKRMWHFGHMKGETILQVHGMGPFLINFGPIPDAAAKPAGE